MQAPLSNKLAHTPHLALHRCTVHVQQPMRPCPAQLRHRLQPARASTADAPSDSDDEEGLTREEDYEVPGGYQDTLSSNTPLGRVVREACGELENLGGLELEVLNEAEAMLKKFGFKGSLFTPPPAAAEGEDTA